MLTQGAWTAEEEHLLVEAHMQLGNKWSMIAKRIPGRSENDVKNHWNANLRRRWVFLGEISDTGVLINEIFRRHQMVEIRGVGDAPFEFHTCITKNACCELNARNRLKLRAAFDKNMVYCSFKSLPRLLLRSTGQGQVRQGETQNV